MSITNLLAQGFNPLPAEIQQNALMAGQQMQERRMRNALLQQQMQAAQEERAAQQRNALMADQRAQDRAQYLGSLDASAGPARPLDPARALMLGFKPDEIKTLQGPAPAAPMRPLVLPDGTVLSGDGTKTIREAAPTANAKIGALNPESWTPASLAEYQKTGNPAVLRRFVAPPPAPRVQPPAGGDAPIDDRTGLSQKLGVPIADRDPFAGMSPKDQATFKRSLYTAADKKLTEADEGVSSARNMARDAQRFLELQSKVSMQGPVAGRVFAISSEAQEMDAITDKITPQMRQPGSGATSDFDAKMFRNSTVSRVKNEAANTAIANGIVLSAKNSEDRAQFMRDYLTVNGHLDGADRQWKRYADANPIFDPQSPNEPKINPKRVPYQQFFGGGAQPAQPPQAGGKTVVRTGTMNGRKVVQYSDGTTAYAD